MNLLGIHGMRIFTGWMPFPSPNQRHQNTERRLYWAVNVFLGNVKVEKQTMHAAGS